MSKLQGVRHGLGRVCSSQPLTLFLMKLHSSKLGTLSRFKVFMSVSTFEEGRQILEK